MRAMVIVSVPCAKCAEKAGRSQCTDARHARVELTPNKRKREGGSEARRGRQQVSEFKVVGWSIGNVGK